MTTHLGLNASRATVGVLLALVLSSAPLSSQATWTLLPVGPGIGPTSGAPVSYDPIRNVSVLHWDPQTWEFDGSTWSNRTNGPAPRIGWFAFDALRGRHVLFELPFGITPTLPTQRTWEWDGTAWTNHGFANAPVLDIVAGMAYDPRRGAVILFGNDQAGGPRPGTWAWDGTQWSRVTLQVEGPVPSSFQLATDWVRQRVLMINLSLAGNGLYGTYALDDTGWRLIPGTQSAPYRPGAAIAQDPIRDRVLMFGGSYYFGPCSNIVNDTWEFDGTTWIQRNPYNPPPPIVGAAAVYNWVERSIDMFGGQWQSGVGCGYRGDLVWRYASPYLASTAPAGAGCSIGAVIPSLDLAEQVGPWTGERYEITLNGIPQTAPAAMLTGFSNQSWAGRPLPADLGFLGAPGCSLHLEPFVSYPFLAGTGGSLRWSITVPGQPSLAGLRFFNQAVVAAPGANLAGLAVSDALLSTVGVK